MFDGFEVIEDVARAETLPPRAFIDADVLAAEMQRIFERAWLLLPPGSTEGDARPLLEQVRTRGSYATLSLLERPLFLQRDWKDVLRCFPNVCTHAWHVLLAGRGRHRTFACPQHGRKFDCEGRFKSQAGFAEAPDFPRECAHLRSLPLGQVGPLGFVCLGSPAASFDEVLVPVIADAPLASLEGARVASGVVRDVAGNWKLHAWNFLDHYHIPFVHGGPGGLGDACEMASYTTELYDWCVLQWVRTTNAADAFPEGVLPARFGARVFALWWFVFPNLALNFYPWGLSINQWMPIAGQPERTRFHWYHLVTDEARYAEADARWINRATDDEDVDALSAVQRGVRSGFATRGRFAPREEAAAHWFHRRVWLQLSGG
jgi:choline monooxygenase